MAENAVQAMDGNVTAVVEPRKNDVYVVDGDVEVSSRLPRAWRGTPGGHAEGTRGEERGEGRGRVAAEVGEREAAWYNMEAEGFGVCGRRLGHVEGEEGGVGRGE